MILILLFLFLKWLALPLTLCVYLTIFLYDKSSGNDEMPHGVCRCFTFPGVIFCVCDLNLVHSGWVASEHSFFFFLLHHVTKKIWRGLGCYGGTFLNLLSKGQPFFGLFQRLVQKWFFYFNTSLSVCHTPFSCLHLCVCYVLGPSLFCIGDGFL